MKQTAVSIKNLAIKYGQTLALSGVCLDVADGEFLGILGPNGGGKSTLLKGILGLIPLSSGVVQIYGQKPRSRKRAVGYVPQFTSLDKQFPISVFEVVLTGRLKAGLSPFFRYSKADKEATHQILEEVGIAKLAKRQISELSGGEFQKMLIARALAVKPKLLLLDEPTASVDAASRDQIYALLTELNRNMTIILVTHDLFDISSQVDRIACINKTLLYQGKPELTEDLLGRLYGCPIRTTAHGTADRGRSETKGGIFRDRRLI